MNMSIKKIETNRSLFMYKCIFLLQLCSRREGKEKKGISTRFFVSKLLSSANHYLYVNYRNHYKFQPQPWILGAVHRHPMQLLLP